MSKSNIEWTEDTWNPIVGCSILSPGCKNCYAMPMAARIEAMNAEACASGKSATAPQYDGTTHKVNGHTVWTGKLALAGDSVLMSPLKRKKPTVYFVNSMGDLFHEAVPDEWIDKVFAVMALSPQHTFQVLTKRAKRMRAYCNQDRWEMERRVHLEALVALERHYPSHQDTYDQHIAYDQQVRKIPTGGCSPMLPLKNVWLGVSTERQQEADERIPELLQTPAAVRFISAEPLLGPLELDAPRLVGVTSPFDALRHGTTYTGHDAGQRFYHSSGHPTLDWVIVGGESGLGARPMHPDWARSLRNQCSAAGVPFFFKQWGEWAPSSPEEAAGNPRSGWQTKRAHPCVAKAEELYPEAGGAFIARVGKKLAGRTLDGMIHDEYPEAPR